jgi:hypothetical protein
VVILLAKINGQQCTLSHRLQEVERQFGSNWQHRGLFLSDIKKTERADLAN